MLSSPLLHLPTTATSQQGLCRGGSGRFWVNEGVFDEKRSPQSIQRVLVTFWAMVSVSMALVAVQSTSASTTSAARRAALAVCCLFARYYNRSTYLINCTNSPMKGLPTNNASQTVQMCATSSNGNCVGTLCPIGQICIQSTNQCCPMGQVVTTTGDTFLQ